MPSVMLSSIETPSNIRTNGKTRFAFEKFTQFLKYGGDEHLVSLHDSISRIYIRQYASVKISKARNKIRVFIKP